MKKVLLVTLLLVTAGYGYTQAIMPTIDSSPLDVSYYPVNYPYLKIQDNVKEPLIARVIYSRPKKNGRVIFGDLIEYDKVWRLGANEATDIEFYQPVTINKLKIKKGRYTLYAIPTTTQWKLIVNKETDTWGAFKYNESKDLLRIDLPILKQTTINEYLGMAFVKSGNGFALQIAWDDNLVSLPITL